MQRHIIIISSSSSSSDISQLLLTVSSLTQLMCQWRADEHPQVLYQVHDTTSLVLETDAQTKNIHKSRTRFLTLQAPS